MTDLHVYVLLNVGFLSTVHTQMKVLDHKRSEHLSELNLSRLYAAWCCPTGVFTGILLFYGGFERID